MSSGFIKLPRSLLKDPIWENFSLEERSIFLTLVFHAAWQETTQNDFGKLITLKPGQLLMTQRSLIDLAFPKTNDAKLLNKYKSSVVRALVKFKLVDFSYHETYQRKTLHTIVREDILEMLVPNFVPNSYQTRTIKEEDKNITTLAAVDSDEKKFFEKESKMKSNEITKFDVQRIGLAKRWTPEEIEFAWKQYLNSKNPVNSPLNYIEAIIKKEREITQKKEKEACLKQQQQQQKSPAKSSSKIFDVTNRPTLVIDTSEQPLAIFMRQRGHS